MKVEKKTSTRRRAARIAIPFHQGQLEALRVAVKLRIQALEDNDEKDMTYGWKIILRKVEAALEQAKLAKWGDHMFQDPKVRA